MGGAVELTIGYPNVNWTISTKGSATILAGNQNLTSLLKYATTDAHNMK